jgi:hypothetical protein
VSKFIDRSGQRFGKWTIVRPVDALPNRGGRYLVRCDCGRVVARQVAAIINGNSRMCFKCSVAAGKHGLGYLGRNAAT